MDSTILSAIIGGTAAIIAAFITIAKKVKKKEKKNVTNTGLLVSFEQVTNISQEITDMFKNTTADRFLLLISEEEGNVHNWVSAIYEQMDLRAGEEGSDVQLSIGATNRYCKLDTDDHYRSMIKEIKAKGMVKYTVANMDPSILKKIYVYEKVKHSNIYYLYEFYHIDQDDVKRKFILFASIAKHGQNPYTDDDEIIFRTTIDKIKNEIIPNRL